MSFVLYALLDDGSPQHTVESLRQQLTSYFGEAGSVRIESERDPFDPTRVNLVLSWGTWWTRIFVESGPDVISDSQVIAAKASTEEERCRLAAVTRRIRVLFADDPTREFTNQVIYVTQFLEELAGATIFDPQRMAFVFG